MKIKCFAIFYGLLFFIPNFLFSITPGYSIVDWSKAGMDISSITIDQTYNVNSVSSLLDRLNNRNLNEVTKIVLNPGDYDFGMSTLSLDKNVIIAGEEDRDPSETRLLFNVDTNTACISVCGTENSTAIPINPNFPGCIGFNSVYLELNDASTINVGDYLHFRVDNYDTWGRDVETSNNTFIGQIVQVASKSGNRVYLTDRLHLDFRNYPNQNANWNTLNPRVYKMTPAYRVGIENLYIGHSTSELSNDRNIVFDKAARCWVSNIESAHAFEDHILIMNSMNIKIYGSYFHHGYKDYGPGNAYGVHLSWTCTNCLVENNNFFYLRHAMVLSAGANGNVFGYNFSIRHVSDDLEDGIYEEFTDVASADMIFHGHYPFANLFEGNIGHFIYMDDVWGSNGPFNMIYKNRTLYHDESFGLQINDGNPKQNVIGNFIFYRFSWVAEIAQRLNYYGALATQVYEIFEDEVYEYHNYDDGQIWNGIQPFKGDWNFIERRNRWFPTQGSDAEIQNSYYLSGKPFFWPTDGTWPYTARGNLIDDQPAARRNDSDNIETYDYKDVALRNADLVTSQIFYQGYLSLHRNTYSAWYDSVASSKQVRLLTNENYVDAKVLQASINDKKHINWNYERTRYLLETDDIQDASNTISAYYTEQEQVSVTWTEPASVFMYDPWFVSDTVTLEQPDCFIEINTGQYKVFLNQGGSDPNNLQKPYYSVRAQACCATQDSIYVFDHWSSPNSKASFDPDNVNNPDTCGVLFTASGAIIKPIYKAVNRISNYVLTLSPECYTHNLKIPAGTDIKCANGFKIVIDAVDGEYNRGNLDLSAATESNPITFRSINSNPSAGAWKGIEFKKKSLGTFNLKYINVYDAEVGFCFTGDPATETNTYPKIEHCKFENNIVGVKYMNQDHTSGAGGDLYLYVDNCSFKNNTIGLALDNTGRMVKRIRWNQFVDNEYGIYIEGYANSYSSYYNDTYFDISDNTVTADEAEIGIAAIGMFYVTIDHNVVDIGESGTGILVGKAYTNYNYFRPSVLGTAPGTYLCESYPSPSSSSVLVYRIYNNTVVGGYYGIHCHTPHLYGNFSVRNNIVINQNRDPESPSTTGGGIVYLNEGYVPGYTGYNLVYGQETYAGDDSTSEYMWASRMIGEFEFFSIGRCFTTDKYQSAHLTTNYYPASISPAIDSGDPDFDRDGISWSSDTDDRDPDGTRSDMGAYYCDYPPATPTGFDGVWYNNHPKVFWNAVTDPDLKVYQIWKKKNSGQWSLKDTTSNLTYVDNSELKWTKPLISATIYYKIRAVDEGENVSGFTPEESFKCNNTESDKKEIFPVVELNPIPTEYALHPTYPNPFNLITQIRFDIPSASVVHIEIYDVMGRLVRILASGEYAPNYYSLEWNGRNDFGQSVGTGIYLIKIRTSEYQHLEKCTLIK